MARRTTVTQTMYKSRETFFYQKADGSDGYVEEGDVLDADDPAVKAQRQYFKEIQRSQTGVEAASAAPGEVRE